MDEINTIKKLMLQKLVRANMWGGKHTPIDFVKKGIPEHYRNTHKGIKVVESAVKDLANSGWIIIQMKRTGKGSGEHISLNPRMVAEIKQFLERKP